MIGQLQESVHPEVHLLHRKAARNYQVMQKASRIQIPDRRTRHCRWESPMFLERPLQDDAYTAGEDPFEKDYTEGRPTSLRDFTVMKHLTISVKLPVALSRASIGNSGSEDPSWSLVDILAPNLEYPLPSLKEIAGVDVHIPNAKSVEDPDEVEEYLQLHSV
ncbi:hypothetical protein COH20_007716 [Aspergillus flavus]|nr:hypothetical protein COH20_007716 [Aspergillus flavus]RAQ78381.1 hypothetical protein COH21_011516 [Aspergillus flavus]